MRHMKGTLLQSIPAAALLPGSLWAALQPDRGVPMASSATTVFELRVYSAAAGKLPELLARFRDHTMQLFEKHGMRIWRIGQPVDEPGKSEHAHLYSSS